LEFHRVGFQLLLARLDFLLRKFAHVGVGGHFLRSGDVGFDLLVGVILLYDGAEFGVLAR
jgi:hypothetical protein